MKKIEIVFRGNGRRTNDNSVFVHHNLQFETLIYAKRNLIKVKPYKFDDRNNRNFGNAQKLERANNVKWEPPLTL